MLLPDAGVDSLPGVASVGSDNWLWFGLDDWAPSDNRKKKIKIYE